MDKDFYCREDSIKALEYLHRACMENTYCGDCICEDFCDLANFHINPDGWGDYIKEVKECV